MNKSISTIEDFIKWTENLKNQMLLYRGLSNADYEIESSAYRRIKKSQETEVHPYVFEEYNLQLLDESILRGFRNRQDRKLSKLELLAELQHNGAATCLIDFTYNSLIALWFACQNQSSQKTGKVIAMATDKSDLFSVVKNDDLKRQISKFLNKNKLWIWAPSHLSNRVVAQQSVFVFGSQMIEKSYYEEIKINAKSKKNILMRLENEFGISEKHLFHDFSGFSYSNAHDKFYYDNSAKYYCEKGLGFAQDEEYEKADYFYTKAIEINKKYITAYYNRGIAKLELKKYKDSINDYNNVIEFDLENYGAYNNRGNAKNSSGDYKGAIEDYNKAIKINPQHADVYNNRGNAKSNLGDRKGAITDYNKAIEINPQHVETYNNRGNTKSNLGDRKGAIADYNKAIKINPQYANAYNNRGTEKNDSGDHKGAIADYDKAIEINPQHVEAYNNRGVAKNDSGDHKGAIADCDKAIEINPQYANAYNNRGVAKNLLGDHKGAIADCDKAIEINPQHAKAYYNRGIAKQNSGDLQGANEDRTKALKLDPNIKPDT